MSRNKRKSIFDICRENGGCGAKYYLKAEKSYLVCGFSETGSGKNKYYKCDKCSKIIWKEKKLIKKEAEK